MLSNTTRGLSALTIMSDDKAADQILSRLLPSSDQLYYVDADCERTAIVSVATRGAPSKLAIKLVRTRFMDRRQDLA